MEKGNGSEYPARRRGAGIKQYPGGQAEKEDFDQQPHTARDTDSRGSTVVRDAKYAPNDGRKKRQTKRDEIAHEPIKPAPAPVAHKV